MQERRYLAAAVRGTEARWARREEMGSGGAGFAAMKEQTVRDGSNGWNKSV